MKQLEEFVNEKLKVGTEIKKTVYHPNSKEELVKLMIEEISTNGPECSLNHIDVSNIDDMSFLFRGGDRFHYYNGHPVLGKFDGDISNWDVSNVIDMHYMFDESTYTGKNGDISDWDVSNVTNMTCMFYDSKFNGDISNWDVSNVTDMQLMFFNSKFNGDISNWDVSKVTDMYNMFVRSPLANNLPKWYQNTKL